MTNLLISGSSAWDQTGKTAKKGEEAFSGDKNLFTPTFLAPSMGLQFANAFTGPMACHTVCVTTEGRCYSFGRNDKGQLGLGDSVSRNRPTLIKALENVKIEKAAIGKNHTFFLASTGEVWVAGSNNFGQLGLGKVSDSEDKARQQPSLGSKVVDIACGVEFSMIVTEEGRTYSCGHPEFGVLGHGSDGKFIISTGKEGFREVSSPKLIDQWHLPDVKGKDFLGATVEPPCIKRICCGNKHTLAVDAEGSMWSWGFNGYGRLGLNDPHDRKRPCKVEFFQGPHAITNSNLFTAGGATSGAVSGLGQLYTWGQIKKVGESQVRPWICQDLSGWRIRSLSFGNETFLIACDANKEPRRPWLEGCESVPHVIAWGGGRHGELGYGSTKKSSANPDVVAPLTALPVSAVSAGAGHSVFLLEPGAAAPALPSVEPDHDVAGAAPAAGAKRGKAASGAAPAPKKGKKK